MSFFLYASFPNSRNKNRAPTVTADTYHVNVAGSAAAVPTLVNAANENRTYTSIENTSITDDIYYGYATTLAVDPSVVATFGVTNDLIVSTSTNKLYVKNDDGITTNWTITTLPAHGFLLRSAQIAGALESLQDIYAQSATTSTVTVNIDTGQG